LGVGNGFLWEFIPQGFDAVEFLDGTAVQALGLGFVAQEEWEGVG
jgi:hypothetical protein